MPYKTAPRVAVPIDNIDPLAVWILNSSEPLASAALSLTGDPVVALPSTRDDSLLVAFAYCRSLANGK